MTVEESLRALASDDEAQVPAQVDAAVMAAWEAHQRRAAAHPPRHWPFWVAACAGIVLAAVLFAQRFTPGDADPGSGSLIKRELVLVPDVDPGPLMLMRVRMTRREFSRLGVPISNPQGDGLVDVEVLVGEDGVARSIRRAVAVNWTRPSR